MAETLNQYVSRIIKEKRLTLADVEESAEGDIGDSYIASIIKGGKLT